MSPHPTLALALPTSPLGVVVFAALVFLASRLVRRLRCPFGGGPNRRTFEAYPGFPASLPFLGDLPQFILPGKTVLRRGLAFFRFGPTFKFWCGNLPIVVLSRPEDYEAVISSGKCNNKPRHIYGTVETFFGSGLATINGEEWRLHRKHITHAFHFRILERYVEVFDRKAHMLVDKLRPLADGATSFNVFPQFAFVTNETIFETAFGLDESANKAVGPERREAFVDAMEFAFSAMQERVLKPWLLIDWVYWLTPNGRRFFEADRMIDAFAERVIDDRRAKLVAGVDSETSRYSFLDLMMKLEPAEDGTRVLNDAEIRGELRTFISVQQTSATIMSFAMLMFALHPDVQERVLDEVLEELGEDGVNYTALLGLKYLERVIKETMRLYPVLPAMARDCTGDVQVTDGVIPAGACVVLAPVYTHRLPELWDRPDAFDPDRFLPEHCANRHPYAYLPFSAGSRNCIGQKYAMLQMKGVISTLLRSYEVLPGKGCGSIAEVEDNLDVTTFLTMPKGFNVRLRPREGRAPSAAATRFSETLQQRLAAVSVRVEAAGR